MAISVQRDTYERIIEDMQQRRDVAVSDLQALIDSTVPLPALAEDDTQRERQRPPEDIPGTVEQLTDTVVIAPGAPARS